MAQAAVVVLLSTALAAAALGGALWSTRDAARARAEPGAVTPERASDEFMTAYRSRDFARARHWTTGHLAREMDALAKRKPPAAISSDGRQWLLEESHLLREDKLRLLGVLALPDEDESQGWPVALTLVRRGERFLVEDLHWPKGPPPERP